MSCSIFGLNVINYKDIVIDYSRKLDTKAIIIIMSNMKLKTGEKVEKNIIIN